MTEYALSEILFDPDRRGTEHPPRVVRAKSAEERKGARAMTMKERLKVHDRVERLNRAHFAAWKSGEQRKRKPNVRHIVAVRGERGSVA